MQKVAQKLLKLEITQHMLKQLLMTNAETKKYLLNRLSANLDELISTEQKLQGHT